MIITPNPPAASCRCPHCGQDLAAELRDPHSALSRRVVDYRRRDNGAPIGNLRDRVVVANRLMDWVHLNPYVPGRGRFSDRDGHLEVSGFHVFLEGKPNFDQRGQPTVWQDPSREALENLIRRLGDHGLGVVFYSDNDEYDNPTVIQRTELIEASGSRFLPGRHWAPGGEAIEAYLRQHVPHRYRGALTVAEAAGR